MRRFAQTLMACALLLTATAGAGYAGHKSGHVKKAAVKCPKCKMTLSTRKTNTMTEMVKVHGKTYYCCAACGAHTKAGAKAGGKEN